MVVDEGLLATKAGTQKWVSSATKGKTCALVILLGKVEVEHGGQPHGRLLRWWVTGRQ